MTRLGNSSARGEQKAQPQYAVLVDPSGWEGRGDELAGVVCRAIATLSNVPKPPPVDVLGVRLDAGPATIATDLTKPAARQIVSVLRAMEVVARLTKTSERAPSGERVAASNAMSRAAATKVVSTPLKRRDTQTRMPPREGSAPASEPPSPRKPTENHDAVPTDPHATPPWAGAVGSTSDAWPTVPADSNTSTGDLSALPSLAQRAGVVAIEDDLTEPEALGASASMQAAAVSNESDGSAASRDESDTGSATVLGWGAFVSRGSDQADNAPQPNPDKTKAANSMVSPPSSRGEVKSTASSAGGSSLANAWSAAGFAVGEGPSPDAPEQGPHASAAPNDPVRRDATSGADVAPTAVPPALLGSSIDVVDTSGLAEELGGPAPDNPLARLAAARDEATEYPDPPNVSLATWLGALAPGAGQTYLGDGEAGISYAMAAPLLVPWYKAAKRARSSARLQQAPRRRRPAGYRLGKGVLHVVVFWAVVVGIVAGSVAVYQRFIVFPDPQPGGDAGALAGAADADTDVAAPDVVPAPDTDTASTSPNLMIQIEERRRVAEAQRLLIDARSTCRMGLYPRCATLACRARDLMPEDDDARRLCTEATVATAAENAGESTEALFPWQQEAEEGTGEGASTGPTGGAAAEDIDEDAPTVPAPAEHEPGEEGAPP